LFKKPLICMLATKGKGWRFPLMANLKTQEIKAFVPARDFALSKRFYEDLGFTIASSGDGIAYIHHGNASFLLQDFYNKEHTGNFMMHLLVEDVDAWWQHVCALDLAANTACRSSRRSSGPGACATSSWSVRQGCCGASRRTSRRATIELQRIQPR
jgi:hypothetical protein